MRSIGIGRKSRRQWKCAVFPSVGEMGCMKDLFLLSVVLLAVIPCPGAESTSPTPVPDLPLLKNVRQVIDLGLTEANRHYPAQLKGTITLYEKRSELCFLQDTTAGIFLYSPSPLPELKPGQQVEVTGTSGAGLYSPTMMASNVVVLGEGPMPTAKRIAIERLASGAEDSQWVEIEGIVRHEGEDWGHWVLDVVANGYRFQARIIEYSTNQPIHLIDARLLLRGVAASQYNSKKQLIGFQVLVPRLENLRVLNTPAPEPFAEPIHLGRSLFAISSRDPAGHRVKVSGVVTLQWPGKALFIKDPSMGLLIRTRQSSPVNVGDVIEAVGFPASGDYSPVLEDAIYRKVGTNAPPAPARITATQALTGDLDNDLVQIDAQILEKQDLDQDQLALLLQDGQQTFNAYLKKRDPGIRLAPMPAGSRLRLTGVCTVEVDSSRKPRSWKLWLRSPADIVLLERPAPWLMSELLWVLAALSAMVVAGLAWTVTLRRNVRRQTTRLRQQEASLEERYRDLFENANDILYAHDLEGNFTSLNSAGELVTGYSRSEICQMNIHRLVTPDRLDQLDKLLAGHRNGETRGHCDLEIMTKTGRHACLDVNTRLDYREGKAVGICGIARDITERRQSEEALRQSEYQLRLSLRERQRIGEDLHDDIIQSIYAVGLGIEECRWQLTREPDRVDEQLEHAQTELNRVIQDVRGFIVGLESEVLDGQGFYEALNSLVRIMTHSQSGRFILRAEPAALECLKPLQASHLVHIAREAMSNSLRHAKATETCVTFQTCNGRVRLEIKDNGVGFDLASRKTSGHGLRNLATRAQELEAELDIQSQAGQGTRVLLILPQNKA